MLQKVLTLKRQNLALWTQMGAILSGLTDDKGAVRDMTADEKTSWEKMDAEFDARRKEIAGLEAAIERQHRHDERQAGLDRLDTREAGRGGAPAGAGAGTTPEKDSARRAFRSFITQAPGDWDSETRDLLAQQRALVPAQARQMGQCYVLPGRRDLVFGEGAEKRALTAAANATVAEDFMRELDVALKDFSGIAQAARFVNTDTGADMPFPTLNDTANKAHLLAELSAAATNVDPTTAAVVMQAFLYTSDIVLTPNQLMQDSAFNPESWLARVLGERMGRGMNFDGTLADGSSKPRGLITAIMADTTELKAASATAIAFGDIVNLYHAVDPAYRQGPKVAFMMHDDVLKVVEKIVDSNGRPIFRPANDAVGSVATIYNRPVFINQDMDNTVAEDKESIVFGDFNHFVVRRALNPILVRLNERYAEYFQTGFVMFERWDSDLIGGAGRALRLLSHNLA